MCVCSVIVAIILTHGVSNTRDYSDELHLKQAADARAAAAGESAGAEDHVEDAEVIDAEDEA